MKDYAELIVSVASITGDTQVPDYAATLTAIAERKLSRVLRVRQATEEMTKTTNATGEITLPRGLVDVIYVFDEDGNRMYPAPLSHIKGKHQNKQDIFSLSGNRMYTNQESKKIDITYYEELPGLSDHGCNWLLEQAPDIYLQALLQEVAIKNSDYESAMTISSYLQGLVSEFVRFNKISVLSVAKGGSGPCP